jgi:putative Holliday junction resolvase
MRVMAIDYGKKRVGIALSDPLGVISQPLTTIKVKSQKALFGQILEIIQQSDVGLIIIGNPLSHKGEATKMSEQISRFMKQLKKMTDIEIKLWDERFTSQYAMNLMKEIKVKKQKDLVDQVAASIMLDEYLRSCSTCTT